MMSILIIGLILAGCGGDSSKTKSQSSSKSSESSSSSSKSSSSSNSSLKELYPDVCRCLVDPVNTQWAKDNIDTCRDAISEKIGVANWETINFSQNPMLDARWENLKSSCGY